MLYTGLDYHRSFSYITTMNDKGEIVGQKKLPSNGEIADFLKDFGGRMEVEIEATPSWYWLYDSLENEGFDENTLNELTLIPYDRLRLIIELNFFNLLRLIIKAGY